MRKIKTLSTFVMAAIAVAFSLNSAYAQDQTTLPPQASGHVPNQVVPPSYLPPAENGAVQRVGFQEDVKVPSILGGESGGPILPPMLPKQHEAPAASPLPQPSIPEMAQDGPVVQTGSFQPTMPQQQLQTFEPQQPPQSLQQSQMEPQEMQEPRVADNTLPRMTAEATRQSLPIQPSPVTQVSAFEVPNGLRNQQIQTVSPQTPSEPATMPAPIVQQVLAQPATGVPATNISAATTQPMSTSGLIATAGPKLKVTSIGPSSVTIGKSARYEVLVENLENRTAQNVIVGIDFPEWVEVTTVLPTTGSKEATEGTSESLMVWQLPIVEASTTEKIVIDVIPREPRPFDIDVEWTFQPIKGRTTVEVTQPQLTIQISGPTEVQFGEKALYDVTVSNPGNGVAENVNVMLPEALGGERASLENIDPQQQKKFQVELIARSAGALDLTTTVIADGELNESDTHEIMVRRAILDVSLKGPQIKYAGSVSDYEIVVSNQGDAMAREVIAAVALPPGVEFLAGIDHVEQIDGGVRWNVGMLSPGNQRVYKIQCKMGVAGDINVEAASRGAGDLAATDSVITRVEAVADLVLSVTDPKGPLPTGENIDYDIKIVNRGTKAAREVKVVMHFSDGIEPNDAEGLAHELAPGQVAFAPIARIDPGQEVTLKVRANASQAGSHRFRAQLVCEESDSLEVAEGTTRFFGENGLQESKLDNGGFQR